MIRDNYQFLFVFIIFRVSTIEYFKIEKIIFFPKTCVIMTFILNIILFFYFL